MDHMREIDRGEKSVSLQAKGREIDRATFSTQDELKTHLTDTLRSHYEGVLQNLNGAKAFLTKKGLLLTTELALAVSTITACAPAKAEVPSYIPDGGGTGPRVTETYSVPAESPTIAVTPTETASPTPTPEVIAADQALAAKDLEAGHWGSFTFSKSEKDYYNVEDSEGNTIPDLKFFENGTAEFKYQKVNITQPFQEVIQKDGELMIGLWSYKDGEWSLETYNAPKSAAETENWRAVGVVLDSEKEDQMTQAIFAARDASLVKTDTYTPGDEWKNLSVEVNFRTIENFDARPDFWQIRNFTLAVPGELEFVPKSRNSEVVYDVGRLAYARPMQVVLDAPAWFPINVYDKDGKLFQRIIQVPTLAMNADGSLVKLSSTSSSGLIDKLVPLLTHEKRGALFFNFHTESVKTTRWEFFDAGTISYVARVNKYYTSVRGLPTLGVAYPKTSSLPKELEKSLFSLVDTSSFR